MPDRTMLQQALQGTNAGRVQGGPNEGLPKGDDDNYGQVQKGKIHFVHYPNGEREDLTIIKLQMEVHTYCTVCASVGDEMWYNVDDPGSKQQRDQSGKKQEKGGNVDVHTSLYARGCSGASVDRRWS